MLVPNDFTYTTSCMLSIKTFAIRFVISHLLLVFQWIHWNWASISSRVWDTGVTTLTFHGHLTSSVTSGIRFAAGHFLLVVCWCQVSISNGFRDILPQTSCSHRHNAKSSLHMRDVTWHVPNLSTDFNLSPPICLFTLGVIVGTSNVKGQIERIFSKSKNFPNFDLLWAWNQGLWKVGTVTAKGTSLRESTLFEPFCVKIGWGCSLKG